MILEMKRSHKSATFFILGKETVAEDDCVAHKERLLKYPACRRRNETHCAGRTELKEFVELALNVRIFLDFGFADQVSPCHDHLHIAKSLEVVERILVGNDQIGALAGLDSAGDRIDMRNLGVSFRCGVESKPI